MDLPDTKCLHKLNSAPVRRDCLGDCAHADRSGLSSAYRIAVALAGGLVYVLDLLLAKSAHPNVRRRARNTAEAYVTYNRVNKTPIKLMRAPGMWLEASCRRRSQRCAPCQPRTEIYRRLKCGELRLGRPWLRIAALTALDAAGICVVCA
ncbi:hypothetical protein Q3G72_011546 [Acer saccharum]|nr:hypothetical protein Q3G72_011546 [Acer saccharum]